MHGSKGPARPGDPPMHGAMGRLRRRRGGRGKKLLEVRTCSLEKLSPTN